MSRQLIGSVVLLAICVLALSQEDNNNSINNNNNDDKAIDLNFEDNKNLTELELQPRFTFLTIQNRRYSVAGFIKANWYKAQQMCAFHGLTLATITSAVDAANLRRLLETSPIQTADRRFWLSGTTLGNGNEWIWNSNGLPVAYDRWLPGRLGSNTEKCMMLNEDAQSWGSLNCGTQLHFVCENRCNESS